MSNTNVYVMLDCVSETLLSKYAGPAHALAGYVNGRITGYITWPALVAAYGKSGKGLLSIDVMNDPNAGAQCLDVESGDATIADAPGWFKATRAAGVKARDLRWYPKFYTSESNLVALVAELTKAGIKRNEYLLWSAHYTGKAHICGPKTCGSKVQADATQWDDKYQGAPVDVSAAYGYFFAGPPALKPVPKRHVADGSYSLETRAAELHVTVGSILASSAEHLYDEHLRLLVAYLANGTAAKMPDGLVFWTAN